MFYSPPKILKTNLRQPKPHSIQQSGTSMISVLVSLLIISGGLFSGMRLQAVSLTGIYYAKSSTHATSLISDIAERMHINISETLAGSYDVASLTALPDDENPDYDPDCSQNVCNPTQLAAYDLKNWQSSFPNTLNNISAAITPLSNNTGAREIIIRWDDDGNGSTGTNCPPIVLEAENEADTDLDCVALEVSFK